MFVGFPSVGMYRRLRREKFGTCLVGTRTCLSCREIRILYDPGAKSFVPPVVVLSMVQGCAGP